MKQQLINEIKIQSYLNHPNLIQLYDFFYDQERIYLFMELTAISLKPWPPEENFQKKLPLSSLDKLFRASSTSTAKISSIGTSSSKTLSSHAYALFYSGYGKDL